MSVIEKLDPILKLMDELVAANTAYECNMISRAITQQMCAIAAQGHGPAIRQAMIDAEQLAAVRIHLPTKVETTIMAGMDAEEMAAFDSGYNAALDRAHLLLMASAAPANEALEPDSLGFGARTDAANNRATGEGEGHD